MSPPRPRRPLPFMDSLEARRLLHASVDLTWTFSPSNPSAGTQIADHGGTYKKYGDYTFGWNANFRDQTRTTHKVSNKTLDSYIHVKGTWQLALPNGQYKVTLTSGDAKHTDSVHVIDVEGVRIMNGTTSTKKPFRTESDVVNVRDGKLTLRPASMGVNVKLNSIRIQSIEDDELPVVSMKTIQSEAREQPSSNAHNGLVRVSRATDDTSHNLTVNLAWSGSAAGKDIVSRPSSVTIPAGQTSVDLSIVAKTDKVEESAETAVVTIAKNDVNYTLGKPSSASIRVANTPYVTVQKPVVSVSATGDTATEGGSDGEFTFTRSGGDTSQTLTVLLLWSGSANGTDIESRPGSIQFAAGSTTTSIAVEAKDDLLVEPDETATVTIDDATNAYTVSSDHSSASVTVVSDDTDEPVNPARNSITWANAASAPDGATEAQVAVVNGIVYRFGGYRDSSFVASRKAEKYDPATNTWTSIANMPIGFTHSATVAVGTKVWMAGAYEERVGVPGQQNIGTTRVLIYDTVANSWSDGPSLPEARGSGGMELIDNKLYFTSGERLSDRQEMGTTWMYDLANTGAGWQTRADMPSPRSHFGTATVNGIMYVLGGQTGHDNAGVPLKTVYAYNPATNTWTQKADLPLARSHQAPATVAFESKIYLFGGDNPANSPNAQVTEYDPTTGTSRLLTSLPSARMAGVATVVGDKFIFTSGYDYDFRATTWIATWS